MSPSVPPLLAAVPARTMSWPDYVALAAYFALSLAIGWWCSRRKRASSGGFFLGNRHIPWWAAAISFMATATSSISFMALPARTYESDWLSFGSAPAQVLAGIVVGVFFVAALRRLELTTIFGYLEQRFDPRVQLLGAGLGILLKVGGRMSVVMLLPSLALSTVTGLNVYASILLMGAVTTVYAMEGGFDAVIWTDVMQVGVTIGGVAVALVYMASSVDGGFTGLLHHAAAAGKFRMVSTDWDFTQPTLWVFIGMFLGHIFTVLGDQPLMQRMLATADVRAARRSIVMGNVVGFMGSVMFFLVGTSLWAFYAAHPERAPAAPLGDKIFPYFIANELPPGVVGLIVAGLFAAGMGALSSNMNATAAIVVSDFQGRFRPAATEAERVRLARRATLAAGAIATGMAVWLAWRGTTSLWDQYLRLVALIGGGFPGVFALGLLTRRANPPGVIVGALTSVVVTWAVQTFTATSSFFHGFVAVGSCIVVGYLASLAFGGAVRGKKLGGLTVWDRGDRAQRSTSNVQH
ncbi:MAG TPA: sodium:solute symporter [Opitutaceae bacterium]|nr:sodium:solute symporter [Opitutaceae bacterium]